MLFITSENLKPGMVLAMDLTLYNKYNFKTLLLKGGQSLSNSIINKIRSNNISGVYIKNEELNKNLFNNNIDDEFEGELLIRIKDIFYKYKLNNTVEKKLIWDISDLADNLIKESIVNKTLYYNTLNFNSYDDYYFQHCLNACILSISLGDSLNLKGRMLQELAMAALLHDIGMLTFPEEIICKEDNLSKKEIQAIRQHPIKAVKEFKSLVSNDILRGILNHHEHVDGTGYPYALTGNKIHLFGKIIAVCDSYQALTTDFYYRKAISKAQAYNYIAESINTKFDPEIAEVFLKNIIIYPVGEYVKLNNSKTALVYENNTEKPLRPVVKIINQDGTLGDELNLLYEENQDTGITGTGHSYEYIVSSCLCGEKTRYDGKVFINEKIKKLVDDNKAIMVCPEILGGMSVPRLPCEIQNGRVVNISSDNKTNHFVDGAIETLKTASKYGIKKAILKEKSPSCGSSCIYDGSFTKKLIPGEGITTRLLRLNNIEVISDEQYIE
ncbi:2-thiouracil desulfurase family protein [Sedimentibacter sp.]|uniref:2-thiouracil desulfurase family protein n=1 Tax=Sedimentibacter sp. TaxID=1960295 RepID=UPI0028AB7C8C|nr:2-thiouracil desulfurase family protein [Sedimentibacter sp.]